MPFRAIWSVIDGNRLRSFGRTLDIVYSCSMHLHNTNEDVQNVQQLPTMPYLVAKLKWIGLKLLAMRLLDTVGHLSQLLPFSDEPRNLRISTETSVC